MRSTNPQSIRIIRGKEVRERTGESRSTRYLKISKGLFPTPVRLGVRTVGWPEHEIDAVLAARIAGQTDDQIRKLVRSLVAARASFTAVGHIGEESQASESSEGTQRGRASFGEVRHG